MDKIALDISKKLHLHTPIFSKYATESTLEGARCHPTPKRAIGWLVISISQVNKKATENDCGSNSLLKLWVVA